MQKELFNLLSNALGEEANGKIKYPIPDSEFVLELLEQFEIAGERGMIARTAKQFCMKEGTARSRFFRLQKQFVKGGA